MDYRSRALNQMLDGQQTNMARFMEAFTNARLRPPRLDDLPHWQQLDLAPNPALVDFESIYLPVLHRVTLRMAQLQHPPVIANPLWSAQLAHLETHMNHWEALRGQLQQPDSSPETQAFRSQFQTIHGRQPTQDDAPTWHHILLTEDIVVARPLTWAEYQTAAHNHMLHPLAPNPPSDPQTTAAHDSTPSPEAYTPLSSPPRTTETLPTHNAATDMPHRTPVTTSPCLIDKRRGRISGDRIIAQQHLKEQQVASRRHARQSLPAPTPASPLCCNRTCTNPTPPEMGNGSICAATNTVTHISCMAPAHRNQKAAYCLSCQQTPGTPANQC